MKVRPKFVPVHPVSSSTCNHFFHPNNKCTQNQNNGSETVIGPMGDAAPMLKESDAMGTRIKASEGTKVMDPNDHALVQVVPLQKPQLRVSVLKPRYLLEVEMLWRNFLV